MWCVSMDRKSCFSALVRITAALVLLSLLFLCGCTVKKLENEKTKDIEFTVVAKEEIPEELKEKIEEGKENPVKMTYGDGEYLYIVRGDGRQETTGCSIEVKAVYETENAVYIQTELKGPEKGEEILEKATCPYVVVKIEYRDTHVVFD